MFCRIQCILFWVYIECQILSLTCYGWFLQCGGNVSELLQHHADGGPTGRTGLWFVSSPYIQAATYSQVGTLHASAAAPTVCYAAHNGQCCHLFFSSYSFYIHIQVSCSLFCCPYNMNFLLIFSNLKILFWHIEKLLDMHLDVVISLTVIWWRLLHSMLISSMNPESSCHVRYFFLK